MHSLDILTLNYLVSVRTPFLVEVFYALTSIFNVLPFALIILLTALWVYNNRGIFYSGFLLGSVGVAGVVAWVLKHTLNVARPAFSLVLDTDPSFPSGHATLSAVFFMSLMFIFSGSLEGFKKIFFNIFCISIILLVSFSRLYLGAHWLSDVLVGIVLGVSSSVICWYIFQKVKNKFQI